MIEVHSNREFDDSLRITGVQVPGKHRRVRGTASTGTETALACPAIHRGEGFDLEIMLYLCTAPAFATLAKLAFSDVVCPRAVCLACLSYVRDGRAGMMEAREEMAGGVVCAGVSSQQEMGWFRGRRGRTAFGQAGRSRAGSTVPRF